MNLACIMKGQMSKRGGGKDDLLRNYGSTKYCLLQEDSRTANSRLAAALKHHRVEVMSCNLRISTCTFVTRSGFNFLMHRPKA